MIALVFELKERFSFRGLFSKEPCNILWTVLIFYLSLINLLFEPVIELIDKLGYHSIKSLSNVPTSSCLSFLRARFSICLMRSLVSPYLFPISSRVYELLYPIPNLILRISSSLSERLESASSIFSFIVTLSISESVEAFCLILDQGVCSFHHLN